MNVRSFEEATIEAYKNLTLEEMTGLKDEDAASLVGMFLHQGLTHKELYDLSDEDMESCYALAYLMYKNGKYEDARAQFAFLVFYDHLERKYWLGLAAALQMLEQYENAVTAYSIATLLDVEDPLVPFHAAECHIGLGDTQKAKNALEASIMASGDNEAFADLKNKASALLELLNSGKEGKEK